MNETDVKEWLTLASHDIETAELLIKQKGHADIIIYHLHQAIEKLLKALLMKSNITLERTHFLDKLLTQLFDKFPSLSSVKDEILEINLYLPKLRYPSGDRIEFDEALAIYSKFNHINEVVRKLI
ncbi:HEPN domain-containing protein [Candidatus Saganbacteria bacterium]|nr:HEPN domain-containing protein [Candidatus Saganbacteria bacterium]